MLFNSLQHGRYDYCRKSARRESARGCWKHRFDQLYDRGILIIGVCSGFAIPVAQMFGAGDRKALCRYARKWSRPGGILSVVMTVLVCIWCRILILMKTPSDILNEFCHAHLDNAPRNSAYGAL